MGKCPKCGSPTKKDEKIYWRCSSCNDILNWNLEHFVKRCNLKNNNNIKKNAKHFSIIISILLAISLLCNGVLFYQYHDSNSKLTQNIVDNTNIKVKSLNDNLKSSQNDLLNLQTQYKKLESINQELTQKNNYNNKQLSSYQNTIKNKNNRINILQEKIDKKDIKIIQLREKVSELKDDKQKLQTKLNSRSRNSSSSSTYSGYTVYITEYGSKYHRAGCRYLWNSSYKISISSAKSRGYTPCSVCNP